MVDDDMSSLVRVSIRDIKQNYFWLSVDCGDVKNLVLRKWQQNNDVKHNERSNECRFFFAPERLMWVRDLMLSPWRLIMCSTAYGESSRGDENFSINARDSF